MISFSKIFVNNLQFSSVQAYSFLASKIYVVLPLIFIHHVQIASLCPSSIVTANLKSIFHMQIYDGIIQWARLESVIAANRLLFSILIYGFSLILIGIFIILQKWAITTFNTGLARLPLSSLLTLIHIYLYIILIPSYDLIIKNFFCSDNAEKDCFTAGHFIRIILGLLIFINNVILNYLYKYFSKDLKYFTENMMLKKDSLLTIYMIFIIPLLVVLNNVAEYNRALRIISCAVYACFALFLVVDYLLYFHFWSFNYVNLGYYLISILMLWEGLLNLFQSLWSNFASSFDLDLMTVGVLFTIFKLSLSLRTKKKQLILDISFYAMKNLRCAGIYLEHLAYLNKHSDNNTHVQFELYSQFGQHISTCQFAECKCKMLKIKKSEKLYQTKSITSLSVASNGQSDIIEKKKGLESILDYELTLDPEQIFYVISHFFLFKIKLCAKALYMEFFFSALSYLIFQQKNYVLSLIMVYQMMEKLKGKGVHNLIMLNNYLQITKIIANKKIGISEEYFMSNSLSKAFEYYKRIDELQNESVSLLDNYYKFCSLLTDENVCDLNALSKYGLLICEKREQMDKNFGELLETNKNNPKLLATYINYSKCIAFDKSNLKEYYDILFESAKKMKVSSARKAEFTMNNKLNLLNPSNNIIFARMHKNDFYIHSFTKNCLTFFKTPSSNLYKKPISHIIPKPLKKYHKIFLQELIDNNTKSRKIHKHKEVRSFVLNNNNFIKPVQLFMKMEINYTDNIYATCLIHPCITKNNYLLLSETGLIYHVGENMKKLFGDINVSKLSIEKQIYIFQFIPSMAKYIFRKSSEITDSKQDSPDKNDYISTKAIFNKKAIFYRTKNEVFTFSHNFEIAFTRKKDIKLRLLNEKAEFIQKTDQAFVVQFNLIHHTIENTKIRYKELMINSIITLKEHLFHFLRLKVSNEKKNETLFLTHKKFMKLINETKNQFSQSKQKETFIFPNANINNSLPFQDNEKNFFPISSPIQDLNEELTISNIIPNSDYKGNLNKKELQHSSNHHEESALSDYEKTIQKKDLFLNFDGKENPSKNLSNTEILTSFHSFQKRSSIEKDSKSFLSSNIDSSNEAQLISSESNDEDKKFNYAQSQAGSQASSYGQASLQRYRNGRPKNSFGLKVKLLIKIGFVFILFVLLGSMIISLVLLENSIRTAASITIYDDFLNPISFSMNEILSQKIIDKQILNITNQSLSLFNINELTISYSTLKSSVAQNNTSGSLSAIKYLDDMNTTINLVLGLDYITIDQASIYDIILKWTTKIYELINSYDGKNYNLDWTDKNLQNELNSYWDLIFNLLFIIDKSTNDHLYGIFLMKNLNIILNVAIFAVTMCINCFTMLSFLKLYAEIDGALLLFTKIDKKLLKYFQKKYKNSKMSLVRNHLEEESKMKENNDGSQQKKIDKAKTENAKKETAKNMNSREANGGSNLFSSYKPFIRPSTIYIILITAFLTVVIIIPLFFSAIFITNAYMNYEDFSRWLQTLTNVNDKIYPYHTSLNYAVFEKISDNYSTSLTNTSAIQFKESLQELEDTIQGYGNKIYVTNFQQHTVFSVLNKVINNDFCIELNTTTEEIISCQGLVNNISKSGLIISTEYIYQTIFNSFATFEEIDWDVESIKNEINVKDWIAVKSLMVYVKEMWSIIQNLVLVEIISIKNSITTILILCSCSFLFLLMIFSISFNYYFINSKNTLILKIQKMIFILPGELINDNAYIKNYLKSKFQE